MTDAVALEAKKNAHLAEHATMERKWREWCEVKMDQTGLIPLELVPNLLLALVKDERSACMKIAAEYGGRDSQEIADLIGARSFQS